MFVLTQGIYHNSGDAVKGNGGDKEMEATAGSQARIHSLEVPAK